MRGKGEMNAKKDRYTGITPAYAGKSITLVDGTGWNEDHPRLCGEKSAASSPPVLKADHPRLCGEKFDKCSAALVHMGSPPPMRGKVRNHCKKQQRLKSPPPMRGKD